METTVSQKEETFQVVIDLIKNSKCFKAFTISADVSEIFMQQFWYTVKKVQGTDSYEFILANKKCIVNVDVFRTILDICLIVEGVNFVDVPYDDATLSFLIKLRYKGPLYKHTNMFVDHMHQPWRTLAAIINKCLSGKTASNDKLRKSRIDILLTTGRRRDQGMKICHSPDSPRLKFVRIGKDYQEYGLPIPETMLTEAIKLSESYKMFIKYSTGQIPPKKSNGKGSQGKKTTDTYVADVDVSEESDLEPPKRKTASRRVVKKKVTIFADDNIISDDPDVALELGKSISKAEAEEAEAARQVHATYARIVTESVPEPTRRRKSGKVTSDPPKRLKGVPSLTPEEQEVVDTMQALKEKVLDESILISATSSEGTGTKIGAPDEEKVISEEIVILEWGSEQESGYLKEDQLDDEEKDDKDGDADDEGDDHISDTQDDDDDDAETESDVDEIYKYKIHVRKDVDAEIAEPETVKHENKEKDVLTDAAKPDVEKNAEEVGDAEKAAGSNLQVKESTGFPLPSSSLSVSSGFGTQFFNSSSNISLTGVLKDTAEADVSSLMDITIQQETPHIQSPTVQKVHVSVILKTTNLPPIPEILTETPVSTAVSLPHVTPTISTVQKTSTPIPTPPIPLLFLNPMHSPLFS
ncbi:hypothetical protein Tco_1263307 [Tanacetum coccineum]